MDICESFANETIRFIETGTLNYNYYVILVKESLTPVVTIHASSLHVLNGQFDSVNYFIVGLQTYKYFMRLCGNDYN
jgi:hypothetical protein